jgi:hypothetical protein
MANYKYADIENSELPDSAESALAKGLRLFVGGSVCACGHTPPIKHITSLNPLKWACYECRKERDKNKKRELRKSQEYRDHINEVVSNINKARYWQDEEYRTSLLKKHKVRRAETKCATYGITKDDYDRMFAEQYGVCAICAQPETARHGNGETRALHIDHDHKTGRVRGLLCTRCNYSLGGFQDSVSILKNAIGYLENSEKHDSDDIAPDVGELVFPINRKIWEPMNQQQKDALVDKLFNHYRKNGFPFHKTPDNDTFLSELEKTRAYMSAYPIIVGSEIRQTMHMLGCAWSFYPHAYDVKCNSFKTPMDVFNDDVLFRHALHKRLKIGTYLSDGGVRKMLMSMSGTQSVSNFRPTAAAAIMEKYSPVGGIVFDPCAGWGGRMMGAKIINRRYICVEPSIKTYEGLLCQNEFMGSKFEIYNDCAEDFVLGLDVDLVFTSPPYFNCEKYSQEGTQSWVRYKTKEEWFNEFLVRMSNNAISKLKTGGFFILNLADVSTYQTLTRDFMIWATKNPEIEFVEELRLTLSKGFKSGGKYEPVFVFKKR